MRKIIVKIDKEKATELERVNFELNFVKDIVQRVIESHPSDLELINGDTYICVMHKARALGNLYFWNKYYRKNNMNKRMKNYVPDEWALEIISESELNMLKELERED